MPDAILLPAFGCDSAMLLKLTRREEQVSPAHITPHFYTLSPLELSNTVPRYQYACLSVPVARNLLLVIMDDSAYFSTLKSYGKVVYALEI
jgi:hypothetical protein